MEMREYLEELTGQIRCVKARSMVEEEIRQHIEDQAEAFRRAGMDGKEAEEAAVREMGDPVEAGTRLDRIHRPRMEWGVLVLVAVLSLAGLVVRFLFNCGGFVEDNQYFLRQACCIAAGFVLMVIVYRLDYTWLADFVLLLWLLLGIAGNLVWNHYDYSGRAVLYAVTLLYMPLFAGVLYRFRGGGYAAVCCCMAFLLVPFYIAMLAVSGAGQAQVLIIGVFMLSVAIGRGWFRVKKGITLVGVWGFCVALPPAVLAAAAYSKDGLGLLKPYQADRIKAFLDPAKYAEGSGYQIFYIRQVLENSRLIGGASFPDGYRLPGNMNDYMMTGVIAYYGILAGALLLLLILFFLGKVLRIAWRQKNQLGSMAALGCALVFMAQGIIYLHSNLFGSLIGQMYLPFVSYEPACTLTNFILMGIFLSVYRGGMIVDERQLNRRAKFKIRIWKEDT